MCYITKTSSAIFTEDNRMYTLITICIYEIYIRYIAKLNTNN